MNSPTTNILQSIKHLKSKLKHDRQALDHIRTNFGSDLSPVPEVPPSPPKNQYKSNKLSDRLSRQKLLEVKKNNQVELRKLKQQHEEQIAQITQHYENKLHEQKEQYERQIQEQSSYIEMLEEQINTARENRVEKSIGKKEISSEQYQHLINHLLAENTQLLEKIEHMQVKSCEVSSRFSVLSGNQGEPTRVFVPKKHNKQRLRFSKCQNTEDNKQNIHFSQVNRSEEAWSEHDDTIYSEDAKIKTIKHFIPECRQ